MKLNKLSIITLSVLCSLLVITACKKKKDTIAKVYVRDSTGNAVNDCQVILKGVSTINKSSSLADTAYTSSSGEAIFNFNDIYQSGQAGVAVLDIFARKDGMTGTGIIQINEETTSEAKVVIQE